MHHQVRSWLHRQHPYLKKLVVSATGTIATRGSAMPLLPSMHSCWLGTLITNAHFLIGSRTLSTSKKRVLKSSTPSHLREKPSSKRLIISRAIKTHAR